MIANQRWRERRHSFRRPDEQIRPSEYEVAELELDATAKDFVVAHHYSGSYPAARARFGMFRRGELVGVAVFSHPCRDLREPALRAVELGRFVLLDEVPGNGETWFLARAFEVLRARGDLVGVLSFSDPFARVDADGREVFPGHIGTIYQAHNARYLGRGPRRTLRLLPDGSVFSDRAASKIRAGHRGWAYSAGLLVEHGATAPACLRSGRADPEELRAWLPRALALTTRKVRHPGNHKYAWAFTKRARTVVPLGRAYPKFVGGPA